MKNTLIERTALRYGIITGVTLIAFFFLMLGIGMIQEYELRILNIIFLFAGVYMAINSYREGDQSNYLGGIGVGMLTSGIALVIFSTFVIIFLATNPLFMESLRAHEYFGRYLNPYIAGVVIFIEGTISGLLVSFILMQYYKRSHLKAAEPSIP